MKKILFSMGVMLSAAFALTNCTSEMDHPVQAPSAEGAFEIIAKTADTKTVNDGMYTIWEGGDTINVFHAAAGSEDYVNDGMFTIAEADVEDGRFTGDLGAAVEADGTYDWYAFFPYTKQKESPADAANGYAYIGHSKGLNQTGYDNMGALRGSVCPLYGVAKAVAGDKVPGMTMQHLSSAVAVQITNDNDEPLTVKTVSFTAPEAIVGSFYMTFADGEPTYAESGATYVNSTAVVNVKEGTALAKGESATVYIAIKPFTAAAEDDLTLTVNGYEKTLTMTNDVTFHAGKIKTLKFKYDYVPKGKTATFDFNANEWNLPLSSQDTGMGDVGNIVDPVVSGDVTMTAYNLEDNKSKIRMWQGSSKVDLRAYKGSSLAFSVPEGYVITKMTFDADAMPDASVTAASGTFASKVWAGQSNPVVLTFAEDASTIKINSVTVEYEAGTGDSPELPEQGEPDEPDQPVDPSQPTAVTIAEFNAAEDGGVYELSGTITEIDQAYSEQYNNVSFYIEDATGRTLIYRMSCEGVADPAAITVGDEITVQGTKTTYSGSAQMAQGGKYISHTDKAAPEQGEVQVVTVAQFLAAAEDATIYELTGTIQNVKNTYYGNFDLVDETGSVYIYGIVDEAGNKIFEQNGLSAGDVLTIRGTRKSYNGSPQMKNAVYVTHTDSEPVEPEPDPELPGSPDATVDFTVQGYTNAQEVSSLTSGAVTVTLDKGTNSNTPKWYNTGSAVRVYGGGTFTVSSTSTIKTIKITFGSGDGSNPISADSGTFSTNVWTGSANDVVFTVDGTTGNRRIQKIEVYFN